MRLCRRRRSRLNLDSRRRSTASPQIERQSRASAVVEATSKAPVATPTRRGSDSCRPLSSDGYSLQETHPSRPHPQPPRYANVSIDPWRIRDRSPTLLPTYRNRECRYRPAWGGRHLRHESPERTRRPGTGVCRSAEEDLVPCEVDSLSNAGDLVSVANGRGADRFIERSMRAKTFRKTRKRSGFAAICCSAADRSRCFPKASRTTHPSFCR